MRWLTSIAREKVRTIAAGIADRPLSPSDRPHGKFLALSRLGPRWEAVLEVLRATKEVSDDEERVIASAVALIIATDAICTAYVSAVEALTEDEQIWCKLGKRSYRLMFAAFVHGVSQDKEVLEVDKKKLKSKQVQQGLLRCIGCLRSGVTEMETAETCLELLNAVSKHSNAFRFVLENLDTSKNDIDFDEKEWPPPGNIHRMESTLPASLTQFSSPTLDPRRTRDVLEQTIDCIGKMRKSIQGVHRHGRSLGRPSWLVRRSAEIFSLCFTTSTVGIVGIFVPYFRPGSLIAHAWALKVTLISTAITFYHEHVEGPVLGIMEELFENKSTADVWRAQAKASKDSLTRMLTEFTKTLAKTNANITSQDDGLNTVIRVYEEQMAAPVRNMMMGNMLQALLIQVHSLKTHMEEEAAVMHTLMKANQINMQVMAAVPALIGSIGVFQLFTRLLYWATKKPAYPRKYFRFLLRSLHRLIVLGPKTKLPSDLYEHSGHLCFLIAKLEESKAGLMLTNDSSDQLGRDLILLANHEVLDDKKLYVADSMLRALPDVT